MDLRQFLKRVYTTFPQLLAAVTACFVTISDGMHYGLTSPVIPILLSQNTTITPTLLEIQWLETILLGGFLFGIPFTIATVNAVGPKKSLLISSTISIILWIVTASADKSQFLNLVRFLSGMSANMSCVAAPMYIAEISEKQVRGFLINTMNITIQFGIFLVYSIVPLVPHYIMPIALCIFLLLEIGILPLMPESPYFLLYTSRQDGARNSLSQLRPCENTDEELKDISNAVERQKSERGRVPDIFLMESNRKALMIVVVLNAALQFSGSTVIWTNVNIFLEQANYIKYSDMTALMMFCFMRLLSAIITSALLLRFPRKTLLILSTFLTGVCLSVLGIFFGLNRLGVGVLKSNWIVIAATMCYGMVFQIGLGGIPNILSAELFPVKMKSLGMCLGYATSVIFAVISLEIYYWLSYYGLHFPLLFFAALSFAVLPFIWYFVPETKGKSLEEIQIMLKSK